MKFNKSDNITILSPLPLLKKAGVKGIILTSIILLALLTTSCQFNPFNHHQQEATKSTEFIAGSDIPLFVSLTKFGEENLDFDSASGSISSLIYESGADLNKVRIFYIKTMPQMGWRIHQNGEKKIVFYRQKQKLEIELTKENNKNLVKFFILE